MLGVPPGTGLLVDPGTKRRLVVSLAGSVVLSVLDMLGVLAMLPMMQLVAGGSTHTGALGLVRRVSGAETERGLVLLLAAVIVGAFVVKDLVAVFFRLWQLRFMAEQEVSISARLLRGYLVGPYAWDLARNSGDKLWTVESAVGLGFSTGISALLALVTEVLTISLIFFSLLVVVPLPAVVAFLYFGTAALVTQRLVRRRVVAAGAANVAASQLSAATSLQSLGAVKEIKLRRAADHFVDRYELVRRTGARARATASFLNELPRYLLEIVFVLGIALLAVVVTTLRDANQGLITIGVFVAAGSRILPSSVRLISAVSGLRYSRPPLKHLIVENRMQMDAEIAAASRVRTDAVPEGDVEIRGLEFAYSDAPDALVLRGVDADVPRGAMVAVVGSSGAGKSTLVDLLLGLHLPTAGRITAGGVDIADNMPGWQRGLAVVPQDVYLLDESLRANIVFDEEPDEDRLAQVLDWAQLSDLVQAMPEGLDTTVGERGVRLSGGQRQRIGIARALYRQPRLLVLDEATSALDNETERRLSETIESLHGHVTMLVVAHRLSTVRHCDELVFMSDGAVASVGTFDQVAASNEEFANLVDLGSLVH